MNILTIYKPYDAQVLAAKAQNVELTSEGLKEARDIAEKLLNTIAPLMPAAGLAAPQIGISKRIFIYSWNRSDNMEVVINPTILKQSRTVTTSWEACFSAMQPNATSKAAQVTRPDTISVSYFNLEGQELKKELEGFAARVFQHENDHLEGIVNVNKKSICVKIFENEHCLTEFMIENKKTERLNYKQPTLSSE